MIIVTAHHHHNMREKKREGGIIQCSLTIFHYSQAIAGQPIAHKFDPSSSKFTLSFRANTSISSPSEVYLNEKLYYPNGYSVKSVVRLTSISYSVFSNMHAHFVETLVVGIHAVHSHCQGQIMCMILPCLQCATTCCCYKHRHQ